MMPFDLFDYEDILMIWLFNVLTLVVYDESYFSREHVHSIRYPRFYSNKRFMSSGL
jgi:hypothetical protein